METQWELTRFYKVEVRDLTAEETRRLNMGADILSVDLWYPFKWKHQAYVLSSTRSAPLLLLLYPRKNMEYTIADHPCQCDNTENIRYFWYITPPQLLLSLSINPTCQGDLTPQRWTPCNFFSGGPKSKALPLTLNVKRCIIKCWEYVLYVKYINTH